VFVLGVDSISYRGSIIAAQRLITDTLITDYFWNRGDAINRPPNDSPPR
jgi:hypothetical protein